MTETRTPQIYNIPAGYPFAKTLAIQILQETAQNPSLLPTYRIILPSRRACRVLRDAFLQETSGKPILLPQLQSIGDVNEEELSLSLSIAGDNQDSLDIPPALPAMKRRFLLTKLIEARPDYKNKPEQALALAIALGQLLDHIYTENLDIKNLDKLAPAEFADHWQITLDFLKIISQHWPEILKQHDTIDEADRRNRLILTLSKHLQNTQPTTPIIAAGSTGSIPATAELLTTISKLPNGRLILPGLDTDMDEESWNAIEDHHPQYGLKHLLNHIEIDRSAIKPWPTQTKNQAAIDRNALTSEIMRPAETTGQWQTLNQNPAKKTKIEAALNNLSLIECENEQEEATLIALLMRETLSLSNDQTCALITPSRTLAKRVKATIKRWNITLDDTAGEPLSETNTGRFILLTLKTLTADFSPVALLSLIKHSYIQDLAGPNAKETIATIDKHLRGQKPPPGLESLKPRFEDFPESLAFIEKIQSLIPKNINTKNTLKNHIINHIQFIENLADTKIWEAEDGNAASTFFSEILTHADLITDLTPTQYLDILETLMRTITVRPAYGTHPRLHILGQLEARMINANRVIMAGLNEGTWPPDPGHDPWMSRPMRKDFGLPSPERSIGLAAHDFTQGLCATEVIMTRSKRSEGTPTIPARWIRRFTAILNALHIKDALQSHNHVLHWARTIDQTQSQNQPTTPITRPEPRPPIAARPTQLPVTKIETWLQDPYTVYARYILHLRKLETLEDLPNNALKGTIIHKIFERFVSQHQKIDIKNNLDTLYNTLIDTAKDILKEEQTDPVFWEFWWPRFERIAHWFLNHETIWQNSFAPLKLETKGQMTLVRFTLTGIADRIDISTDKQSAAILDYKSGGTFTQKSIINGKNPQLPLEALILSKGGFENTPTLPTQTLAYLILNGSGEGGKITSHTDNIVALIQETEIALKTLIQSFTDPKTPYHCIPNPDNAPRFNDYAHLARIAEWGTLGDDDQTPDQTEAA